MFPVALPCRELPAQRSLRVLYDAIAEQESALFHQDDPGPLPAPRDRDGVTEPELPNPLTGGSSTHARSACALRGHGLVRGLPRLDLAHRRGPRSRRGALPDVRGARGRRGAADRRLRPDAAPLRAARSHHARRSFDGHVDQAGTFVPPWLSPEVRRLRSQEVFDRAMRVAREQGFAAAAPLFEGVRGDCFAPAQIAIAVHELRELGDTESALGRLDEVMRVAPRNVAARMQRAQILGGRRQPPRRRRRRLARRAARAGERQRRRAQRRRGERAPIRRWASLVQRERGRPRRAVGAAPRVRQPAQARGRRGAGPAGHRARVRGGLALRAHPPVRLGRARAPRPRSRSRGRASSSPSSSSRSVRWLYATDPNPHFVYGQALASRGDIEAALPALEHAARMAPDDAEIAPLAQLRPAKALGRRPRLLERAAWRWRTRWPHRSSS